MPISAPVPSALIDAFVDGKASVFVGAGLSAGAGLPDWAQLMSRFARDLGFKTEGYSALDVAQFYRDLFGAGKLAEVLFTELRKPNVHHTPAHEILVGRLRLNKIYTTNFDALLESACAACGREPQTVFDAATLNVDPRNAFRVIKLHGDLQVPQSIVLGAVEFEGYLQTHAALVTALAHAFQSETVLFLGYGFGDADVRGILQRARRDAGAFGRRHYIVLYDPAPAVCKMLDNRGLDVIPVAARGDRSKALAEWLTELHRQVDAKRALVVEDEDSDALPKRRELIGRKDYCDEVLERLHAGQAVMVCGLAGMGKTSVATVLAHEWRRGSAGRAQVVWFAARERSGPTRWLNVVLDHIGLQLGSQHIARCDESQIDWKREQINSVLADLDRPVLVVLDNFETIPESELIEVAAWIATLPPPSTVLVTSRPLSDAARELLPLSVVELDGLAEKHALDLLDAYANQRFDKSATLEPGRHRFAEVARYTQGNPEAMRLAFGVVQEWALGLSDLLEVLARAQYAPTGAERLDAVFDKLLMCAFGVLGAPAKALMACSSLFVSAAIPRGILVRASELHDANAARDATEQATQLGLLEPTLDGRHFLVHPKVREYAAQRLPKESYERGAALRRCADEYLRFVKTTLEAGRRQPDVRYWKALVSSAMRDLDPQWPMIREMLEWARRTDRGILREFVMYLVHYMDSRCLNPDRLAYATAVVESLGDDECLEDHALLRIDALAWTYLEEGRLEDAVLQIARGEQVAERLEDPARQELLAVATAWKAVARTRMEHCEEGRALIERALQESRDLAPWIRMRIEMAAGDIALASGHAPEAYAHYGNAIAASNSYEDGLGYQLLPRIGLSLILMPDRSAKHLNKAQQNFDAIRVRAVPLGQLYGDYGLGLVQIAREELGDGRKRISRARAQLEQRRASSLLRALLDDSYERIDPQGFAASSPPAAAVTPVDLAHERDPEILEIVRDAKRKRKPLPARAAARAKRPKG